MLFWPSLAVLILFFLAAVVVAWTCAIDLKLRILADELTIALALLGIAFRWLAWPYAGPWFDAALGALAGAGVLALIRAIANKMYGFETMGLGDVKLMGAAGIWLGVEGTMMALALGSICGVLHGLGVMVWTKRAKGDSLPFREMTIPAGPGFCAGSLLIAIWQFRHLPLFEG